MTTSDAKDDVLESVYRCQRSIRLQLDRLRSGRWIATVNKDTDYILSEERPGVLGPICCRADSAETAIFGALFSYQSHSLTGTTKSDREFIIKALRDAADTIEGELRGE